MGSSVEAKANMLADRRESQVLSEVWVKPELAV